MGGFYLLLSELSFAFRICVSLFNTLMLSALYVVRVRGLSLELDLIAIPFYYYSRFSDYEDTYDAFAIKFNR